MYLVSVLIHSSIGYLLCGSRVELAVVWLPPSGRGRRESIPPSRKCSAFYLRLQFYRLLQWRGRKLQALKLEGPESYPATPRRLRHLRRQRKGWVKNEERKGTSPIIEVSHGLPRVVVISTYLTGPTRAREFLR